VTPDSHGGFGSVGPHDHARHHELQPDASIERHGPFDGNVKPEAREQLAIGHEAQTRTAQVDNTT
jgi:hypothetical protein